MLGIKAKTKAKTWQVWLLLKQQCST